jgi:hypothetical protein
MWAVVERDTDVSSIRTLASKNMDANSGWPETDSIYVVVLGKLGSRGDHLTDNPYNRTVIIFHLFRPHLPWIVAVGRELIWRGVVAFRLSEFTGFFALDQSTLSTSS